ncbi:universal stress protein [Mycolicibacterium sp. P9-64]|uniref:universal stress protein n=1 Tax=Mycolicibacterium sp. P9-64 TaxID=2024612 RepID=UPI0011EF8AE7|nr:universal stress protein [Mycolicibacterium sp. P9-64]KAA0079513.1 universal stress protein [Mycolicibacterium sp. P9-64]
MTGDAAPIVVGVNGSSEAVCAARWAGAVAARLDVPLHIITATPYLGHLQTDAAAGVRAAAIDEHRESAKVLLKAAEDAVVADHPDLVVTTISVDEPADVALDSASRTAQFLVLGSGEVTAAGALFIGSTTLATLTNSTCPVVAWRGDVPAPTDQTIVVGVDGSADDGGPLGIAFEIADRLGAPLRVIHSWSLKGHLVAVNRPIMVDWNASTQAQWRHVNKLVDGWRGRHPGVKVTLIGEPAKPSQSLLLHAVGAQLVVVGSRRRNALTRGLFGSTSLNLLHHCKVPVMLCPFDEQS